MAKMNLLEKWMEDMLSRRSRVLEAPVRVEGIRKAHLGGYLQIGQVLFVIEPANGFEISIEIANLEAKPEYKSFIESAIFGFLDVVMLAEPYPFKDLKVRVVGAEFDPVSSSVISFRLAGRDAGKKFLEEQKHSTMR